MNTPEVRQNCAQKLLSLVENATNINAFIGLDGFVDEIVHAVDKRENATEYTRLPTISSMANRIEAAAGKSTNIEMVTQRRKLGGNGPIMANALATLGLKVTYVGALGYPVVHPVFQSFGETASIHSIADPGRTDAVEFLDGKLMLVKSVSLNDITWENIQARYGREPFIEKFTTSELVAFVNWTMIPYMSEIWEALLADACPALPSTRRYIFFDLADPEKRPADDIARALELISRFERCFNVILGLNEKEAYEVADVLALNHSNHSPEALSELALQIQSKLLLDTVVIHPVTYALAASKGTVSLVRGPVITKPVITTGAGDHFNSGFCLGKLLGLDNTFSLLAGVSTSGFYVKTGQSPRIQDLADLLCNWPVK
jgi:fructose-1-phosphate kinase PfkB-like protein